jgi:hypothetical protein
MRSNAAVFASLPSLLLFPVLGLAPEAGARAAAFITFCGVFRAPAAGLLRRRLGTRVGDADLLRRVEAGTLSDPRAAPAVMAVTPRAAPGRAPAN